ncbi:MAG: hypothetical protein ACPGVG_11250 [Mycobacterium sp.]
MSGRMYSAIFEKVAATAAQDLFEVVAPSTAIVVVHALYLSQDTEEGDAQSEMLSLLIHRGTATGSGGTSETPNPLDPGDSAFGGTCEVNNTTQSVEGTHLHSDAWNVQIPYQMVWTPETRPVVPPSGLFIVELQDAPADSVTISGTLYFEEMGT